MSIPAEDPRMLAYRIAGRESIAEVPGLRVRVLTLAPGETIPWHCHSVIDDTLVCLDGPMTVSLDGPRKDHRLSPGGMLTVAATRPHFVVGVGGGGCRFLLVQGVGQHDFVPVPPPVEHDASA